MKLSRMVAIYLRRRRRAGTIGAKTERSQRCVLEAFVRCVGDRPVATLQRRHVERWWAGLVASPKSDRTRRYEWSTVHCFCRWRVDEGHLGRNPFGAQRPPRMPDAAPRPLSDAAVAALLSAAGDERARAVIALSCFVGLRAMEIVGARIEDWDRRDQTLRVLGKGRKVRTVPIPEHVVVHLAAVVASAGSPSTGPFIRSKVHPWAGVSTMTASRIFAQVAFDAGVKARPGDGVNIHAGRHTAATNVADRSGDLRLVQELLGHAHLNTVQIYTRSAGIERLRSAMTPLDAA